MMVCRKIRDVALQMRDDLGLLLEREALPVRAARAVGLDEVLLAREHEVGELAFLERFDDLDLQQRRFGVIRIELDERVIGVGCVLIALLLEIEVAQVRIGDERVRPRAVPVEMPRDRLGTVEIREADRQHAERVVDELLRAAHRRIQHRRIAIAARVVVGAELPVEQREERFQAVVVFLLLEQRPAVLVQRLLVKRRAVADTDHVRVGALGLAIALLHEQRLAAAKLRLVQVRRARVLGDELVERRERLVDAALRFVSARELIENEIVLRVLRISLQKPFVHLDRAAESPERLHVRRELLGVGRLELQVGEPPHRFRAQHRIVGGDVEKQAIALHGFRFTADDRRVRVDLDVGALEVLDRARRLDRLLAIAIADERPDRRRREQHEQRRVAHGPLSPSAALASPVGSTRAAARS